MFLFFLNFVVRGKVDKGSLVARAKASRTAIVGGKVTSCVQQSGLVAEAASIVL